MELRGLSFHERGKSTCEEARWKREDLGVIADELDSMAGVDGGGAEPALLQPHGAASFLGTALLAPNQQRKRVWRRGRIQRRT